MLGVYSYAIHNQCCSIALMDNPISNTHCQNHHQCHYHYYYFYYPMVNVHSMLAPHQIEFYSTMHYLHVNYWHHYLSNHIFAITLMFWIMFLFDCTIEQLLNKAMPFFLVRFKYFYNYENCYLLIC